ncbi:MAG TPA: aminotransferase class V-fold PLP-dependent enzyme [Ktedonobacteraceae bacterium]|nr:aminotransferase class V-fold PLP-dependent enzyme [Ktedonobacteraceae bacterium]
MPDITHLQRIRQEMPATTSHLYLNTGTFGPLPACVISAMQERLDSEWRNGRLGAAAFESMGNIYSEARTRAARLLNAREGEIALTDNTGEGLNIISYGIDWQAGDEVITTNHEHISLLAPLYQLRDRSGIVIRFADLGPNAERPILEAIADLVTSRTRLISLSHVTWTTGAVLDIREVGRMGRELGIPVLIDGAQSAGAIPIDVKALGIDFYAIPMQKWLCGPDGTGALYTRRESLAYVRPTYVGYWSIKHEEGLEWELLENAQSFEVGGRQTASLAGQAAVLNWLENTVGYEWLFERISSLNAYAYNALKTLPGVTMLTPKPGASGLLSFKLEGCNTTEAVNYLREEHNIHIRNIPSMDALRISTGFYNKEDEIDTLVGALKKM